MNKTGRPSIWAEHRPEMVRLYTEESKTRGEIARRFGTSVQTVTRQLAASNTDLELRMRPTPRLSPEKQADVNAKISASRKGKGLGQRVDRREGSCPVCSETFLTLRPEQQYCSTDCYKVALAQRNTDEGIQSQAEYNESPKRCQCGNLIDYEHRHTRQFCSPTCRIQYQPKRQSDPTKQVIFVCQNCGKTVTKPRSWGKGYFKYCSNDCAKKHTKTKQHIVVEDAVVLDSKWEALFWGLAGMLKIPCNRTNRVEGVAWSGPGSWYAPDFHLPGIDVYVEVKGQEDSQDPTKWDAFRADGLRLVVVDQPMLDRLRRADDAQEFVRILSSEV